ncbi:MULTISPECIES: PAS domain S-box protein [Nostoc]|uniref:histidine kinase n=1 Tax=Nostoc paludosum FACHB-159 TaxID=2692908 RepID=A0ABR8K0C6_9NOSO|nr:MULTISPECIES: PAS domain S-box protein [Nostoc]MBD2677270.1 PAS domain S-box protein [Nostoc sp. FACHB-857]MBD2732920.1 PAS domain S-box protein [Nostoc paludosum FACHB-159]
MSRQQLQVKQLQTTLNKMEVTLDAIADAVVWVGEDQRIQWCNSSFEFLVNQAHGTVCGLRLIDLLPLTQAGQLLTLPAYPDIRILNGEYQTTNYQLQQSQGTLTLQISGNSIGLTDEKCAILVIRNITETKQAQESLQEVEERLQTLINATPDIICLKDGEGKWLLSNQANLEFLELEGVDYRGKTDSELAEFSTFYRDALLNCSETDEQSWQLGSVHRVEEIVPRPDGTTSSLDMIKAPLFHQDGRRKAMLVLGRDISDRKKTQLALENSLSLLNAIFESIQDGILVVNTCSNITSYNQKFLEMWSIPPELLSEPSHPRRLAHLANQVKDPDGFLQRVRELYQNPEVVSYDSLELRDGRIFERYSCPQRVGEQIIGRVWSFRDVTQRQRAEEALRQSELEYRSIFEAINDGLFITEIETETVIEINPAACQMHGYTYEEFIGLHPSAYIHPDSHPVFNEFVEKTRAGEQFYGQAVDICKDGTLIDVEVKGTTCIYNGKPHILAIVRDITARKRTQEALRQSEAQYRDLVQTANCIILRWDSNGDIIFLNDYGQRLFGFDLDEITGRNVVGTIVPETETSGRDLQALMVDICEYPEKYIFNENENLCKNGDRVWIVWANKPILDEQGNLVEILSVGTDATERKRAQAALQENELKFRSIVENANDLIFVLSPEGIFTYHSPNVTAIMGYALEEIEGHSVVEFTKPEDLPTSAAALQRAITGEKLTNIEVRLRHKDGSWRWFNFNTSTINTSSGEIAIAGVGRDITERKQAEEALRRSEMKYRNIFENSQVGIFRTRPEDGLVLDANDRGANILGFASASDIINKYFIPDLYVNPNERALVVKQVQEYGEVCNYEVEMRRLDGSVVWLLLSLRLNSEESCLDCVVTDISDRKQQEQALRLIVEGTAAKTGDEFFNSCVRYLAEVLQVQYALVTEFGDEPKTKVRTLAFWCCGNIGDNLEYDLRGTPYQHTLEGNMCHYLQGVQAAFPEDADLVAMNAESFLGVPLTSSSGDIIGHLAVIDVKPMQPDPGRELIVKIFAARAGAELERKQAEAALQQSELKFRTIVEKVNDVLFVINADGVFNYISPNILKTTGFDPSEIEGNSLALFTHPDDVPKCGEVAKTVLATGEGISDIEFRGRHRNGGWVWQTANIARTQDAQGNFEIVGVARDITDRKLAEAALQRRTQAESLISSISRQFIDQDLETAINFTLQAIAQFIDAEHSCIFECSNDQKEFYLIHEWCGEHVPPLIEIAKGSPVDVFPYFYEPILRGRHRQISRVQELPPHLPERKLFETMSFQSLLAVPMTHAGRVVGFVGAAMIHSSKTWNQEDINLLKLVGEIIAIGRARHQAEEALRIAKEAAETANRAKSAFLANMSHELRTPLNAILGFSQLMERDTSLKSNQRESLATINRSGEHLLNLINDVLEMSKIEAGQIIFNPEDFDLYFLLQTLQEMFQVRTQAKQLFLKFEMSPNLPRYIQTDEGKLRQILINLLGNAVKFTQAGGVTLRVRLGRWGDEEMTEMGGREQGAGSRGEEFSPMPHDAICSTFGDQMTAVAPPCPMPQSLIFEIEDTGRGIAQEEMNNLFQPFVQTSSGIQTKEGTGLGLTISRQFVRLLGGDIHITSTPGKGSIFSFDIEVNLIPALKATPKLGKSRVIQLAANQPDYRILVVDDRKENCDLIVQLLGSVGFNTKIANNGQDAIAIWQNWQPHLIWMDMRMPVMNGYDATKEIRARERNIDTNHRTVIIALTASAFEEQQASILAAGCDDLVRKPFREQVIFEKMAEYLHVDYIYAEQISENATEKKPDNIQSPILDLHSAIAMMPAEWISQLNQAAIEVDAERIFQLIEQIEPTHSNFAEELTNLVRNFCFDEIIDLTEDY